jgi:hypothetical protein
LNPVPALVIDDQGMKAFMDFVLVGHPLYSAPFFAEAHGIMPRDGARILSEVLIECGV